MLPGYSPLIQAIQGTLFTWGVTALGSALVYVIPVSASPQKKRLFLDVSLGFAGGVMLAASYWSLLEPALEEAATTYGEDWAWIPVAIGFLLGGAFVVAGDLFLPEVDVKDVTTSSKKSEDSQNSSDSDGESEDAVVKGPMTRSKTSGTPRRRMKEEKVAKKEISTTAEKVEQQKQWKRLFLLVLAITVHNFPEGLAVGVAFQGQSFSAARSLAIGIGLQNFPEGAAVSIPLEQCGVSRWKAFFWGQISGMVEPIGGLLGAVMVEVAKPILPYALAFAAGAMIYVVVDDLIPEAVSKGNGRAASWGVMVGFVVMMVMDVAL